MAIKSFDFIVIGGGLGGLLTSHALSKNFSVALVETSDNLGGNCRPIVHSQGTFDFSLKLFPCLENSEEELLFLERQLQVNLGAQQVYTPPLTFLKGEFHPFTGFGDAAPKYVDEISFYTLSLRWKLQKSVHDWVSILCAEPQFEVLKRSQVTQVMIQENRVESILINGNQKISAANYIYCADVKELLNLFSQPVVATRNALRVNHSKLWSTLSLDLIHEKEICQEQSVYLLQAQTEGATPHLGLFHEASTDTTHQHSQWLTFLAEDPIENEEASATELRDLKRQIKRAFPTAFDNLVHERIAVCPNSHGTYPLKLNERFQIPDLENLYVASGTINPIKNIFGTINQVRRVLEAITPSQKLHSDQEVPGSPTFEASL